MQYRNEFVISKDYYGEQGWSHVTMKNTYIISYDSNLKIGINDDNSVILLGWCWSIDDELNPYKYVAKAQSSDKTEILDKEKKWVGRYVLVVGDTIFTDACGIYSVFLGDAMISSSLALIGESEHHKHIDPKLRSGMNFIPGKYTSFEGVYRLLPSQSFDIMSWKSVERGILRVDAVSSSDRDKLDLFSEGLLNSLKNMEKFVDNNRLGRLALPLTGGWILGRFFLHVLKNMFPLKHILTSTLLLKKETWLFRKNCVTSVI